MTSLGCRRVIIAAASHHRGGIAEVARLQKARNSIYGFRGFQPLVSLKAARLAASDNKLRDSFSDTLLSLRSVWQRMLKYCSAVFMIASLFVEVRRNGS